MTKKTNQIDATTMTRDDLNLITVEQFNKYDDETKFALFNRARELVQIMSRSDDRKSQVLAILKSGPASLLDIAEQLDINSRNVSSVMTALGKDGWYILTDNNKRKILMGQYDSEGKLIPVDELG